MAKQLDSVLHSHFYLNTITTYSDSSYKSNNPHNFHKFIHSFTKYISKMTSQPIINHSQLFSAFDAIQTARLAAEQDRHKPRNALETFIHGLASGKTSSGFSRMQRCRDALDALDRSGWQRSFHQRLFHDNFIRACARIFWKTEPAGAFARDHQKILEMNGWDHLSQEILVSTPRR
jgi:hypothetical protein